MAGDLLEIEHLAERSPRTHPGMAVTVVRPAALVGDGHRHPGHEALRGAPAADGQGLRAALAVLPLDDLVSALELAVAGDVTGTFAVGCDGWLEQEQVEEISGLRRIELPGRPDLRHRAAAAPDRDHPGARQ